MKIEVTLADDEEGYLDRECPHEECGIRFKVLGTDWEALPEDQDVACPRCGHKDIISRWHTDAQVEFAKALAAERISKELGAAIHGGLVDDATEFNQRFAASKFLKLRMTVKEVPANRPPIVTLSPTEQLLQQSIRCDSCGCSFKVLGPYFFCPRCTQSTVVAEVRATLERLGRAEEAEAMLRSRLVAGEKSSDEVEREVLRYLERALGDLVSSFESYCRHACRVFPAAASLKGNFFQRINDGSKWWAEQLGTSYESVIGVDRLARLNLLVHRRHLLEHNSGLVDQRYLNSSGDQSLRLNQRVVVSAAQVSELATTLRDLIEGLASAIEARAPKPTDPTATEGDV